MKGLFVTREALTLVSVLMFDSVVVELGKNSLVIKEKDTQSVFEFVFSSDSFSILINDLESLKVLLLVC